VRSYLKRDGNLVVSTGGNGMSIAAIRGTFEWGILTKKGGQKSRAKTALSATLRKGPASVGGGRGVRV